MKNRDLSQSFLCGVPLENPSAKDIFKQTGLLHLMVVSGSHLQILSWLFLMPWPRPWRQRRILQSLLWLVLLSFSLISGFQAPLIRALVSRIFQSLSDYFRWNSPADKVSLLSGVLLLLLIPEWILSFSFYLSWLATLGFLLVPLCMNQERFHARPWFFHQALTCLLIQSLMAIAFSQFSWLGFWMNLLLAPVIGLILFPLSMASLLVPGLCPWVDRAWDLLLSFLAFFEKWGPSPSDPFSFPLTLTAWLSLWIFLAAVLSFFFALRIYRYRRSHV